MCLRFMDMQYEKRILAHKKKNCIWWTLTATNANTYEENDCKAKEERPKHKKQRKYSKSDAVHEEEKHQLDQI